MVDLVVVLVSLVTKVMVEEVEKVVNQYQMVLFPTLVSSVHSSLRQTL